MAETILGIDVGSSLIKLVQIERSLQGAVIRRHALIPVPSPAGSSETPTTEDTAPEPQDAYVLAARAIAQAVTRYNLQSDRIVLGLSLRQVFVRHVHLPFTSSSKISQILDFELEGMLPVPVGDLVSVFTKEGRTRSGEQKILTGSMSKEELAAIIAAFRDQGLHIEVIDLSGHGLLALLQESGEPLPDPLVVVDAGHSGTQVFLVSQGRLQGHGFMAVPLPASSEEPSDAALLDPDEEREDGPDRLASEMLASEVLASEMLASESRSRDTAAWVSRVKSLITQSVMRWSDGQPAGTKPQQIVLCGGGCYVQGLGPALELAVHIPVQTIGELKQAFFKQGLEDSSLGSLVHHAAGLALRLGSQDRGFNFRSREFAPQTTFRDRRKRVIHLGVCAALIVGVYLFTLASDVRQNKKRLAMFNKQIRSRVTEVLPHVRKGMRPAQYVSILKDKLAVLEGDTARQDGPGASSVEILQAVSTLVDTSFAVVLDLLTLDKAKVRIAGQADGFATVENMKRRLQGSPLFTEAVIKGVKSMGKDGKVQFTLELGIN